MAQEEQGKMASEERKEKKVTSKGEREKTEKKNVKMDNIRETLKLGQKERI